MKTRNLANGWQAKENCPDLKPIYASTFGRVKFPNVHENQTSAVCCLRFSMLVPFYYQLQSPRMAKIKRQSELAERKSLELFLYSLL